MVFKSFLVAHLFFLAALSPSLSAFVIPSARSRLEPLASSPEDAPKDLERRNDGFSKGLQGWGELLPEDKKYATDSFVDPESGRTTVDVSDLGISMGDLGKKGWNSPENVHPQEGEEGRPAFVKADGTIDWDAMAKDVQMQEQREGLERAMRAADAPPMDV